jgi:prepilin-type N-terminal cleavage/methylation domain-containing protein
MLLASLSPVQPHRPHLRAAQRGFSLVELMVVVIIIAALAVVAVPQATKQIKAQHTQQTAQIVANMYRTARMHALGRGAAMLVRYSNANQGSLQMREAIQGPAGACEGMPVSSCLLAQWNDATQVNVLDTLDPSLEPSTNPIVIGVVGAPPNDASLQANMDVCFSPAGRTFVRYNQNGPWSALTGVPVISVERRDAGGGRVGLVRNILLLPNGAARLGVAR